LRDPRVEQVVFVVNIPLLYGVTSSGKGESMEASKIVARFQGGKIIKGYTQNFFPNRPVFHVLPVNDASGTENLEIQVSELKAVFFVRDFMGNKDYKERKVIDPKERIQGRLIEVTFLDGEVLVGSTMGYDPKRPGFFFFPIDPKSNNVKAYIPSSAIRGVRFP
jgi:hypothetical protein